MRVCKRPVERYKTIASRTGCPLLLEFCACLHAPCRNAQNLKCFPIFFSNKALQPNQKNVFFLGDAFFALPPTFGQGASQAIESAYELFKILDSKNIDSFNSYYKTRIKRIQMIHSRSRLNYFAFHLSNPILVLIRNIILKAIVTNRKFLNKYLGKIYLRE